MNTTSATGPHAAWSTRFADWRRHRRALQALRRSERDWDRAIAHAVTRSQAAELHTVRSLAR